MSTPGSNSNSASGPGTSGTPNLRCPWCPFVATSSRGLNVHVGMKHKNESPPATSSRAASLPSGSSAILTCPTCGYGVANATGLSHHMRAKHGSGSQPLMIPSQINQSSSAVTPPLDTTQPVAAHPVVSSLRDRSSPNLASLKQQLRVLPRIPQGARLQAARKFTHPLVDVTTNNDDPSWLNLLEFAYRVLHVSSTVGVKSLSASVKDNIVAYDRPLVLPSVSPKLHRHTLSDAQRGRMAESRLASRGDLRGAGRLLSSTEALVSPHDMQTQQEMILKHPAPHDDDIPPTLPAVSRPRHCSSDEVIVALRSFPPGSSGGVDGMTAQHILDLVSVGGEVGRLLLENLSGVCDLIARGLIPDSVRDTLYSSWLVAASKPGGGLRPIAVGSTLRRLTAKILLARVRGSAAAYLSPRQLGFGTRGGSEIAVHAARTFLAEHSRAVMVKIDFKNAFNSHRRDTMLKQTHERFPEIYPMVNQAYHRPAPISFGDRVIQSQTGCQQGDVFSPLLFCLVVHGTLERLTSEIAMGYLDDFTLISADPQTLIDDIRLIQADFPTHGLQVQPSKCEVFVQGFPTVEQDNIFGLISDSLPGCRLLANAGDVELLGSPVFEAGVPRALKKKSEAYEIIFQRLAYVGSHVATYILQRSAGIPKLTYLLRTSPAFRFKAELSHIDDQFVAAFEGILKISLSGDALIQLSLPVSSGGMGIPTPSGIALSAFVSSCYAAEDDVRTILGDPSKMIHLLDNAVEDFEATFGSSPAAADRHQQSEWTEVAAKSVLTALCSRLSSSEIDVIRIAHVSLSETGWWLQALPSRNIGTLLTDRDFILAAGLRLGLPLVQEVPCPCGTTNDRLGHHRLSCRTLASGRLSRHNAVNDLLSRALQQAGVANSKEPRNLSPIELIRPDGLTNEPWSRGQQMIWDVSIRDTFAISYRGIARNARGVSAKGEQDKKSKYVTLLGDYCLVPFIIDSTGVWGEAALGLAREIGRRIAARSGDKRAAAFIRQRIAIEVQRGNARMISGGLPPNNALRELNFLSG